MKNYKNQLTNILSKFSFALVFSVTATTTFAYDKLDDAVASKTRTAKFVTRDTFRHPVETLNFFGIKDNMTVVEISPGGGWYTEILAPYLKDNGQYIAAGYDPESSSNYFKTNAKKFNDKLAANPELYGKTRVAIMHAPDKMDFAEPDSADLVVSFRNTHNWHSRGQAETVYAGIFKVLKPGGIFGVVQHRAGHGIPKDTGGKKGYLKQSDVIKLAEKAGFRLLKTSNINANPKDTKDHANGVWDLPPSFESKDKDRKKFQAIGESDRMTLKFVKPHKM